MMEPTEPENIEDAVWIWEESFRQHELLCLPKLASPQFEDKSLPKKVAKIRSRNLTRSALDIKSSHYCEISPINSDKHSSFLSHRGSARYQSNVRFTSQLFGYSLRRKRRQYWGLTAKSRWLYISNILQHNSSIANLDKTLVVLVFSSIGNGGLWSSQNALLKSAISGTTPPTPQKSSYKSK